VATFRLFRSFVLSIEATTAETTGADKDLVLASSIFSFVEDKFVSAAGALLFLDGG